MNKYTIYCTESQTNKAFELGAPIEILDTEVDIENRKIGYTIGFEGFACKPPKINDYLFDDDGNRIIEHVLIKNTEENGDMIVYAPTSEQMILWLEEQLGNYSEIFVRRFATLSDKWCYEIFKRGIRLNEATQYNSRKDATIGAIDYALDYLTKKTKQYKPQV